MASSRETYKDILAKNQDVGAGQEVTSKTLNVQGRDKTTFLVFSTVNCQFTIEWSYDGHNDWFPLANSTLIPVTANVVKRTTLDDCFTYLRLVVKSFAGPGQLSAWSISL